MMTDGRRQQLVGKLQELYGIERDNAENQADEFIKTLGAEEREPEAEKARRATRS